MNPSNPTRDTDPAARASEAVRMPEPDDWLACCIRTLLRAYTSGNPIDFEIAETLLAQEKQTFERDLEVARRIYRLYPHLVDDPGRAEHVGGASA